MTSATAAKNNTRTIFGWAMYDWANSAYTTTTLAVLFPALLVDHIVPAAGYRLFGLVTVDGEQLGSLLIGFGALAVFLVGPILGAIADFSASKKRFLQVTALIGSLFATSMWFIGAGDVALAITLFLLAQMGFVASVVFYDGFLPDITTPDTIDRVSSKGFAFGYLGGGLNFLIVLVFLLFAVTDNPPGLSELDGGRIGMGFAGLWWLAFSLVTFARLEETGEAQALPEEYRRSPKVVAYTRVGFRRTVATTRRLRGFPELARFVLAFILYNDGVQTVIAIAPFYAKETLDLETKTLALGILMVQVIAVFGALFFGRLADRVGTKGAILWSVGLWSIVLAWGFSIPAGPTGAVLRPRRPHRSGPRGHPGAESVAVRVDDPRGGRRRVLRVLLGVREVLGDHRPVHLLRGQRRHWIIPGRRPFARGLLRRRGSAVVPGRRGRSACLAAAVVVHR